MRVIFRVDASNKIGTGHVMRCLTLAAKIPNAEFICTETDGNLIEFIRAKGFKTHALKTGKENEQYCFHSNWLENHWQDDAAQTAAIAKGADWLVVDHYAIDERWEKLLRPQVRKIMLIDDLADRKHDCDFLLDQNYYEGMESRYNNLVPANCVKLLGPKYALLRDEFLEARKNLQRKFDGIKKIFITFGGVDATNETEKVLEKLKDKNYQITAITGAKNYTNLQEKFGSYKNITLLERSSEVAKLMLEADLAIGAGGSTTWERCGLGLPTIIYSIAENQNKVVSDLVSYGAATNCKIEDLEQIDLRGISAKCLELVDCKGTQKVANNLLLNIRIAEFEDVEQVFEIRNKKEVRENSFNKEVIDFETHEKWYNDSLNNYDRHILVLEFDDKIIGVLRYDVSLGCAEVSVYIDPPYFGNGYAEILLNQGENWLKNFSPEIKQLTAKILDKNLKSQHLFVKLGFKKIDGIYRKKI